MSSRVRLVTFTDPVFGLIGEISVDGTTIMKLHEGGITHYGNPSDLAYPKDVVDAIDRCVKDYVNKLARRKG